MQNKLFKEANFENLLGGRTYFLLGNQLLFFHLESEKYVIADVSNDKNYTAEVCYQLPEGAPFELINGKLELMRTPIYKHQKVSMNLSIELSPYVRKNKLGEVLAAPMGVEFDENNVFEPDLMFISIKRAGIIKRWIFGAPDFIAEILSPSTTKRDTDTKMKVYEKHNVLEYWIVNLKDDSIKVYHNKNLKFRLQQTAYKGDTIKSIAIEGFELEVDNVFDV